MIYQQYVMPVTECEAAAFVSEYRALGGDFYVLPDPSNPDRQWFGVKLPSSGRNTPRAGEMRQMIVASADLEVAVIQHVASEAGHLS
jgi:hypothetical protein